MSNISPIHSILSPGAHVQNITGETILYGGNKGGPRPLDMSGSDKGGGLQGTSRPGDMSGMDKAGASILPGVFTNNPTHADTVQNKILPGLFANQNTQTPSKPLKEKPPEVPRYWVAEDNDRPDPVLPDKPMFPMNVHEIHLVEEPTFEMENFGRNRYLPFQDEEEPEEKKDEESNTSETIMVDEAFSWSGHITQYHYSPETLHTNSISLVTTLLPFRMPISNQ